MANDFQLIVFTEYRGWREELYLSLSGNGQFTFRKSPLCYDERSFIRSRISGNALKIVKDWLMDFDDARENRSIHFSENGRDCCLLVLTGPSGYANEYRNPQPIANAENRYRELRNKIAALPEMDPAF